MSGLSRREFLKRSVVSGVTAGIIMSGLDKPAIAASSETIQYGTLIDITKCNGCPRETTPRCVTACKQENQPRFPNPVPSEDIENYWPQNRNEDWSDKKELTNRLTPYNWTFIQRVSVEHNNQEVEVFIPRRCMHCDNPPCVKLCPFGAQAKDPQGPVVINTDLCLGGAKCRDVCPWGIPARQAGVGFYMNIAPKYIGAGVMYKCDLCFQRVKGGLVPSCVEACPRDAIIFAPMTEIIKMAEARAKEIAGYIYGNKENGGTSTLYVSAIPFEKIHQRLAEDKAKQPNLEAPGYPLMPVKVGNYLDTANGWFASLLIAPVAGAALAGYTAYRTMKGDDSRDES